MVILIQFSWTSKTTKTGFHNVIFVLDCSYYSKCLSRVGVWEDKFKICTCFLYIHLYFWKIKSSLKWDIFTKSQNLTVFTNSIKTRILLPLNEQTLLTFLVKPFWVGVFCITATSPGAGHPSLGCSWKNQSVDGSKLDSRYFTKSDWIW